MEKQAKAEQNGLAIASLIFGILSVLTCWTVVLPGPFVLLAFMFALLSRGNKKMCGMALAGMIIGIAGLVLTLIVYISVVLWIWRLYSNIVAFMTLVESCVTAVLNKVWFFVYSVFNTVNSYIEGAWSFIDGIYTYFDNIIRSFGTIGSFFNDIGSFFENLCCFGIGGLFR